MKKTNKNLNKSLSVLVILLLICSGAFAQENENSIVKEKDWHYTIAPYLFVPYVSGDIIVNGNDEYFKANPGDMLDGLKMAGMLYFEAANPKWSISMDVLYAKIGNDIPLPLNLEADITAKTTFIGVYGMYRAVSWFEIGIGARVNILNTDLKLTSGITSPPITIVDDQAKDTWVDPLITYRITIPINNEKWHAGIRGDFGGFGVGSDFSWMVYPAGGYQFSDLFELSLGFRAIGLDFDNENDLSADLNFNGPQLGFVFHL